MQAAVLLAACSGWTVHPPLTHLGVPGAATRGCAPNLCAEPEDAGGKGEEEKADWRDIRARLVAREKKEAGDGAEAAAEQAGFAFESPLIEQGSVILGGTEQEFGFALRQQYFHKCVMVVLLHDSTFTKALILNKPSALELDGWRVWFGGDVAEGGMFRGESNAAGPREITCLHSLTDKAAARLSLPVMRGVSYTTLEGAKELIASGVASRSDFWLFVGYAGWSAGQLQGELERDSWFMASADSATLLQGMMKQAAELPPPSADAGPPSDGIATWEGLVRSIGRAEVAERTRGELADRVLVEWVRSNLMPKPALAGFAARGGAARPADPTDEPLLSSRLREAAAEAAAAVRQQLGDEAEAEAEAEGSDGVDVGTVLRAGSSCADRFLLNDQFLIKSLVLLVHTIADVHIGVVLNRPTSNVIEFHDTERPRRRICFGGDSRVRGGGLDIDSNGLMWLHAKSDFGGVQHGESGVWRLPALKAAQLVQEGTANLDDFILVSGVTPFDKQARAPPLEAAATLACPSALRPLAHPATARIRSQELSELIRNGQMEVVDDAKPLWPQAWSLSQVTPAGRPIDPSDGTALWWASAQMGSSSNGSLSAAALESTPLADETLGEWLKFFAGHRDKATE